MQILPHSMLISSPMLDAKLKFDVRVPFAAIISMLSFSRILCRARFLKFSEFVDEILQ